MARRRSITSDATALEDPLARPHGHGGSVIRGHGPVRLLDEVLGEISEVVLVLYEEHHAVPGVLLQRDVARLLNRVHGLPQATADPIGPHVAGDRRQGRREQDENDSHDHHQLHQAEA